MKKKNTPARFVVLSFLAIIVIGGTLLMFPFACRGHHFTNPITAYFTATSATCVTGLVVVDTETYWSGWGKLIILLLIQFGGLGYMTVATFFLILLNRRVSLGQRMILKEGLNVSKLSGIMHFMKTTFVLVASMEGIGAIALTLRFLKNYSFRRAVTMGIFHSVSAFCNAGFDIIGNFKSFTGYVNDLTVNLTVMILIITGGIGFYVLWGFIHPTRRKLSLHIKIVLKTTLYLILIGAGLFLLFEWHNPKSIANLPLRAKVLAAFFQSVTARTAGFNTIPMSNLNQSTLVVLMLLMFIGGSPGGTAGGIKTTTFLIVFALLINAITGKGRVVIEKRTINKEIVLRAVFIFGFAVLVITTSTLIILVLQGNKFTLLQVMFEVFSAFGTVGLSTGITQHLSALSRLVIITTMFVGRVGPISLIISMMGKKKAPHIGYPEEKIAVG